MDIQLDLDDDESPLSMKADFLLSLCELVGSARTARTRLLQDLYEELLKQPEPEARRVATPWSSTARLP